MSAKSMQSNKEASMAATSSTTPRRGEELLEPSERALLQITSGPHRMTVLASGSVSLTVALGVIGPAVVIAVGHLVGLPLLIIFLICLAQVAAAAVYRRQR
jgi:hypothetical protein